jgi:serine/threonine protein kinase
MSTYTSEPGTRLAGRYRLVDQTSEGTGWTYWKATDETLARPITVLTFAADFPRIAEAITAARAASRLTDPRFSQVFDVEDADGAYVVTEWPAGESLLDMLAAGPLDSPRAVLLVSEAAQALAAAHAAGLAHLRLDPACLHWTAGGGVKITGLGIDAVLADAEPTSSEDGESSELTDTRGLARLLYAALTGYWPSLHESSAAPGPAAAQELGTVAEPDGTDPVKAEALDGTGDADETEALDGVERAVVPGPAGLPAAPETGGVPCTPRQVSAGVPANIDALTCRALFQRPSRHGPAFTTPAMFADALASVVPPDPLPVVPAPTTALSAPDHHPTGQANQYRAAVPRQRTGTGTSYRRPPADRSSVAAAIISAVIVLILAAAGVAGWSLSHRAHNSAAAPPTGPSSSPSSSVPSAAASVVLRPVSANSFDAWGNDGGNEDGNDAKNAIDGNPGTFWHTDYYLTYPKLGNLKPGTGLILDMGRQVRLSQVVVQFGRTCCAHVEIEIGNYDNPVPSALSTFTELSSSNTAAGTTTFDVTSNKTGRYVLIWITYLPPLAGSPGEYEAQIYNVVVHGPPASQSG